MVKAPGKWSASDPRMNSLLLGCTLIDKKRIKLSIK